MCVCMYLSFIQTEGKIDEYIFVIRNVLTILFVFVAWVTSSFVRVLPAFVVSIFSNWRFKWECNFPQVSLYRNWHLGIKNQYNKYFPCIFISVKHIPICRRCYEGFNNYFSFFLSSFLSFFLSFFLIFNCFVSSSSSSYEIDHFILFFFHFSFFLFIRSSFYCCCCCSSSSSVFTYTIISK